MLDFARVQDIIRRVAHRFDPQVLEAMLDLPPLSVAAFADPTGIAAWLSRLQGRLNATGLGRPRYRLDLAQAEELRPDHGIMIPLMFIDPKGTMPVVPILVNANMDPAPSPARCADRKSTRLNSSH